MQLLDYQRDMSDLTFTLTRRSQALAVGVVDRLARTSPGGAPRLVGRLWRLQLHATAALATEPTDYVDSAYELAERLTSLQRQFVQRIFEAMDTREDPFHDCSAPPQRLASVTPLTPRRHG